MPKCKKNMNGAVPLISDLLLIEIETLKFLKFILSENLKLEEIEFSLDWYEVEQNLGIWSRQKTSGRN